MRHKKPGTRVLGFLCCIMAAAIIIAGGSRCKANDSTSYTSDMLPLWACAFKS